MAKTNRDKKKGLQNTTQKAKNFATRITQKRVEVECCQRVKYEPLSRHEREQTKRLYLLEDYNYAFYINLQETGHVEFFSQYT